MSHFLIHDQFLSLEEWLSKEMEDKNYWKFQYVKYVGNIHMNISAYWHTESFLSIETSIGIWLTAESLGYGNHGV